MKPNVTPTLYVKPGCPWCEDVEEYFRQREWPFRRVVVSGDPVAMREMVRLSGQSRAPTMDWDGEVLADFGVEELEVFLQERSLA